MRKYLLPLAVFAAIGAVIIILAKSGADPAQPSRPDPEVDVKPEAGKGTDDPYPLPRRKTPTPLERHRWLSELERALGREDLSHALYFRSKVCEDLDTILADSELTRNLLQAIRTHGIESNDPRRRDVLLPMLRVIAHPEATQMIANEYYKAKTEEERMVLLEAMSHDYHDPDQAAIWAVERTLNSESKENRTRAFEVIALFANNPELIYRTALQIYDSTTRPTQKLGMIRAIGDQSGKSEAARKWLREKLHNPQPDEIGAVIGALGGWTDENDAAALENLAVEFPDLSEVMRELAREIRREVRNRAGEDPEPEPPPVPPKEPRDE